ncbi:MAG TPA: integrase [Bosea sp. (in: a-proteobacteria)]|jgi:hypothetical protein|uniref:integrase n=1 Tax=Bosea sp. (in: a-proteobacteria) TaxID=1871050 RepID=UPI002E105647|nr:integrase [Bosea sp. (in: a-proteobacteria)]
MSVKPATAPATAPASLHVKDGQGVLDGLRIHPRKKAEPLPLFGEDSWNLSPAVFRENARRCHCSVDFTHLSNPLTRLTAKEYLFARLHEPAGAPRSRMAPATVRAVYNRMRRFIAFIEERTGSFRLGELTQADLDAWLAFIRTPGRLPRQVAALLEIPVDLHAHADRLTQGGYQFEPWRGRAPFQVAGCKPSPLENTTPRIPEPVINALLRWSLKYVDVFSADILAARAELTMLADQANKATIARTELGHPTSDAIAQRLDAYLSRLRKEGRGVPVWPDDVSVVSKEGTRVNYGYMALRIGCRAGAICQARRHHSTILTAVAELGTEIGGMDTPISIDPDTGRPWRSQRFDQFTLMREEKMLQAAAYIVCAYLTGMRDSEVQAMRVGCHSVERSADGLIERHRVRSTAYKMRSVTGEAAEWITIAPVGRAVDIAERLSAHARERRGLDTLWLVLVNGAATKDHLSTEIVRTLNQFRAHLDRTQGTPENPAIPREASGQPWRFATRQFRRTIAWHIANRPFGTVAGKIQYKHASIATFEGYAGESASGFGAEVARERSLGRLEDIIEHYEEFRRGHPPTGPAASRLVSEFGRVADALGDLPGMIVDPARLRSMLRHLARDLHVGFLNDCFFEAASALCLRRTPQTDRKAPVLSHCSPERCPNSCLSRRHLPPWEASIEEGDILLRDPKLTANQRKALEIEQARKRALIAPLKGEEA